MNKIQPNEGEALVFFIRPAFVGKIIKIKVSANGYPIGWTRGKQYFYARLKAGVYEFISKAENKAKIKIDIKEGKIYFIKQKISMGFIKGRNKLELLSLQEGN